jgi:uncharacterized protein
VTKAFGDAHYFLALLNARDQDHQRAVAFSSEWHGHIVTSRWILTELADGMARVQQRALAAEFLAAMEGNPFVTVIPASDSLYRRGLSLYCSRLDKDWSLTDCISFVIMAEEKISEALTADHHFEQAGFTALLKA